MQCQGMPSAARNTNLSFALPGGRGGIGRRETACVNPSLHLSDMPADGAAQANGRHESSSTEESPQRANRDRQHFSHRGGRYQPGIVIISKTKSHDRRFVHPIDPQYEIPAAVAGESIPQRFPRAVQSHFNPPCQQASVPAPGTLQTEDQSQMDWRYVRLNPERLQELRFAKSWSLDELFAKAAKNSTDRISGKSHSLNKRTVKAVLKGEPTFVKSARFLADLLGAESLLSVLHPDILREIRPPSSWDNPLEFFSTVGEWDVVETLEAERQTSNGLCYDVWKLRHRHVANRFARAKCYGLSQLSTKDRTRLKNHLTRHSEVCDRVGSHAHISRNLSATEWEHGGLWWVIDEWTAGEKLSDLLELNRLPPPAIPNIMRQIASALQAIHAADIVRRELSPRFVLVRTADQSAVLTDFELAKLLDGAPTVAPKAGWPADPYRAIEVEGETPIDARADLYSWGRILVHAVCGELPAKGQEADVLAKAKVPPAVRRIALSCVAMPRSDRPDSVTKVVAAIKNWT